MTGGTANEEDADDDRSATIEPFTLMTMHRLLPIAHTRQSRRCHGYHDTICAPGDKGSRIADMNRSDA